jgi:hypothetical protein
MKKLKKITQLPFCLFIILLQFCAPSRYVKPLQKKESAVSFSFGGALIKYGPTPIPIPFTTFGYARGLTNRTTAYGDLHFTSALFSNAQADLGATILLYEKEQYFGFTASPAIQLAYNIRNKTGFRAWPSIDLNYFVHFSKRASYFYAGINSWVEVSKYKAHNELQERHMIPNLQIGYTFVKPRWQNQFEVKYLGVGVPNTPGVVEYIGVSGKGTFGIFYSLIRKF